MPPAPATGANVDESRVTKMLYVDPAHIEAADDNKHGTAEAPFATFSFACQAAVTAKEANIGVKIILANGNYREAAAIPGPPKGKADTDAPLVIEAAERDQAVIDGADTVGWTPSTWKAENGRWTHPWPFRRAAAPKGRHDPKPDAAAQSGDLIFVNGLPLRQVDAEAGLTPGTFWGSAAHHPVGKGAGALESNVTAQPPDGTALAGAIVQVGTRRCGLAIAGRRNVVVRGVMFQHAADPTGHRPAGTDVAGLRLDGCANVLIEDVLSQWNDGAGLRVVGDAANVTLRRVRLLHNGLSGLAVTARNVLAEDCEASFNAFRGEWSGHVPASPVAGVSISGAWNTTFRRLREVGNFAPGLAVDQGGNLAVEDSVLRNNVSAGVSLRAGGGSTLVRRCVVAGTKRDAPLGKEAVETGGVVLGDTPNVTLESNVLAGNAGAQLVLREPVDSAGSGDCAHHLYRHNVFLGTDADQFLWSLPEGPNAKGMPAEYLRTLDTAENCFWNPVTAEGFATTGHGGQRSGEGMPLDKWREFLSVRVNPPLTAGAQGEPPEAGSLWQDPRFVDPVDGDFRLQTASPVVDWNLASDEAATGQ